MGSEMCIRDSLYLVPQNVGLIARAQIDAAKIDQVHVGQLATMHFSAFDSRTTPVVAGKVSKVSADIFTDERTGHAFYRADIALDETVLAELEGRRLVPGMPVEAFIATEDRIAGDEGRAAARRRGRRAITTSSPARAASISRESWVLAAG